MLENIRLAFQGIWSHKLRSFLTMLGVIIGIAAIIAIVSTIQGTNEQIKQNLIGAGNNNVKIVLSQGEGEYYMDAGAPDGVSVLDESLRQQIRDLPDVENASFYNYRSYVDQVTCGTNTLDSGAAYGIDQNYLDTCGYVVKEGRGFLDADYTEFRKVVLLDENAAAALFQQEDPLGETIEIRGEPFVVVGIIRQAEEFQPVINSLQDYYTYYQSSSGMLLIPDACWPILYSYDEPQNGVLRASSTEVMSKAGQEAASIMNQAVSSTGDSTEDGSESSKISYKAEDLLQKAQNLQDLSASTNNLLIWVACISLLVGGIGVMNIMLVSVTERTSEIGLKKAIGARKNRILAQFLTESVVLTSCGGILGVIIGIILARVISAMTQTPTAISVLAILVSVGFSMLIGVVFGLLPSVKAANCNPIDALRRE